MSANPQTVQEWRESGRNPGLAEFLNSLTDEDELNQILGRLIDGGELLKP